MEEYQQRFQRIIDSNEMLKKGNMVNHVPQFIRGIEKGLLDFLLVRTPDTIDEVTRVSFSTTTMLQQCPTLQDSVE
jgi:hypothetical protein